MIAIDSCTGSWGENTAWPPSHVIVGDDGSPAAEGAADLATALASVYAAPITLLEAVTRDSATARDEAIEQFLRARNHLRERASQLTERNSGRPKTQVRARSSVASVLREVGDAQTAPMIAVGRRAIVTNSERVSDKILELPHAAALIFPEASLMGHAARRSPAGTRAVPS